MYRIFNKRSLLISLLSLPLIAQAAEQPAPAAGGNTINVVFVGLVTLLFSLLIAIAILGNVLRQLGFVYFEKLREERRSNTTVKTILLFLGLSAISSYAMAQGTADTATVAKAGLPTSYSGIPADQFYLLTGTIALELVILFAMVYCIRVLSKVLHKKARLDTAVKTTPRRSFWEKFHNLAAAEKEEEIMLDHDYDGIKELDNSLPPWWKYGFYVTIVVAVVYMYYYHMGGGGPSSYQEYAAEVEKGEEEKAAYLAKSDNNVDENTVKMMDAAGIAAGETTFQSMCAACHAKDGGGGVGPNLTDEYWLHGGSMSDVFKSIKYGWPDKGMKSWKDDFSPKQIAELTSYVRSLKGTKPAAPKDKQGDLYTEETATTDSTKLAVAE